MKARKLSESPVKHPGVFIPPPIIYVFFFFLAVLLQRFLPIGKKLFQIPLMIIAGWLLILLAASFSIPALARFFVSKNTLMTIRPANSLQTRGIYSITRNPMYLGLLFLYCGLSIFKGNCWNFILLPGLIYVVQFYIIRNEEYYLLSTFKENYEAYLKKVRRWI
jgi:protein-S-isoprenylcysteine O-methyltransferase Ste14